MVSPTFSSETSLRSEPGKPYGSVSSGHASFADETDEQLGLNARVEIATLISNLKTEKDPRVQAELLVNLEHMMLALVQSVQRSSAQPLGPHIVQRFGPQLNDMANLTEGVRATVAKVQQAVDALAAKLQDEAASHGAHRGGHRRPAQRHGRRVGRDAAPTADVYVDNGVDSIGLDALGLGGVSAKRAPARKAPPAYKQPSSRRRSSRSERHGPVRHSTPLDRSAPHKFSTFKDPQMDEGAYDESESDINDVSDYEDASASGGESYDALEDVRSFRHPLVALLEESYRSYAAVRDHFADMSQKYVATDIFSERRRHQAREIKDQVDRVEAQAGNAQVFRTLVKQGITLDAKGNQVFTPSFKRLVRELDHN